MFLKMIKISSKISGAYGHTCCGHWILSKRLVSRRRWSLFHDIKNCKAMNTLSKYRVQAIEMGRLYKGKEGDAEKLWRELLSDPSEWLDYRLDKVNSRFPDFKHKKTQKGLWLDSQLIPPWVEAELAAIPPGTIESSLVSRNKRLSRYVQAGQFEETIKVFKQMQQDGIKANKFTLFPVLNACASLGSLEHGRCIHAQIIREGFEADLFIASSLVDMYAKCGSTEDALRIFNQMPTRDVVTWNALISGYVKCGEAHQALEQFRKMQEERVDPNHVTFMMVLNACASIPALDEGKNAHEDIIRRGYESDLFVGSCLVDMYAKCGNIKEAERVFNHMHNRDVVAWTAMILGYVKCGEGYQALELFEQMQEERVDPNSVTLTVVLNACASVAALEKGRQAHEEIIRRGYEADIFVGSSLVDMYAKCGSIKEAERVFNHMRKRDVVAWTGMILGYVKCGEGKQALDLFGQMQQEGVDPNSTTFLAVLNACASIAALEEGKQAHEEIIQRGYELDVSVGCSLIDMYAKCGSIEDAERVFCKMKRKDVVAWNAMLAGYGWHGYAQQALLHFNQMSDFSEVNDVTLISLLSACSHGGFVDDGLGYFNSMNVIYNISPAVEHYACVVDLLGRAGRLHEAEDLIRTMPMEATSSVWMSLLGACRVHGNVEIGECGANEVLELEPGNVAGYVLLSNIYAATGNLNTSIAINGECLYKLRRKQQANAQTGHLLEQRT